MKKVIIQRHVKYQVERRIGKEYVADKLFYIYKDVELFFRTIRSKLRGW